MGIPRIVINPAVFEDKRDALCVAWNEAIRVVMESVGFEPKSEPTDAQRKFFSDTAYADDEVQLRRTILARIATFDTSVKDPTDDQLAETGSFLDAILESPDWCKNEWERNCVSRLSEAVKASVGSEPVEPRQEPLEAKEPELLQSRAAMGGGETEDEDKKPLPDDGGGGPAEDSNTHAAGPGAADTSGGASPQSDENPYRDMTIAQKLNLADELLKQYEGTDKYDAFKERVDAMKRKYGEAARTAPDTKWNYDEAPKEDHSAQPSATSEGYPVQQTATPEDGQVQTASSEDRPAQEQQDVGTTPSTDQSSSPAPTSETQASSSTYTALDAAGLSSSLVGGVASGAKAADTAGQAVLDKMTGLIGKTKAVGQRAATKAATAVMDTGMKGVTAMKDAADATWSKAASMADRATLLKAKGGTAGEVQAAKNIARNLGAKAAQQSTAAQSALTSLEGKAAEAARPVLSKAAGDSRRLLHTGVKQARTVALKRGAAAVGKVASAAQFAYAGVKSGVKGAVDFADTMRSTGATGGDVMNAVKDTFTTKKGLKNLGKGLIGSLRDVGSTLTGGLIDDGDQIRGTMEDTKGGEASCSFNRKRKRRKA